MLGRKPKPTTVVEATPAATAPSAGPTPAERAAQVEAELIGAKDDLAEAEAELADAKAAYDRSIDQAAIEEAEQARIRIAGAEILVAVARRLVERLSADHAEACAGAISAAAFAKRERLRTEAEETARTYEHLFRELAPDAAANLRKVLRAWAVAQLAHEAATDAGISLPSVDAFRHLPGRPREEIRSWERDLWLHPASGEPFDDGRQERVRVLSDGSGSLSSTTHTTRSTSKRRHRFTEYRPAVATQFAPQFARELRLPALFAGEAAGYAPIPDRYDPHSVLGRLDQLERAQATPRAEPPVKVERKAIEAARDVAVKREPPLAKLIRTVGSFG